MTQDSVIPAPFRHSCSLPSFLRRQESIPESAQMDPRFREDDGLGGDGGRDSSFLLFSVIPAEAGIHHLIALLFSRPTQLVSFVLLTGHLHACRICRNCY